MEMMEQRRRNMLSPLMDATVADEVREHYPSTSNTEERKQCQHVPAQLVYPSPVRPLQSALPPPRPVHFMRNHQGHFLDPLYSRGSAPEATSTGGSSVTKNNKRKHRMQTSSGNVIAIENLSC